MSDQTAASIAELQASQADTNGSVVGLIAVVRAGNEAMAAAAAALSSQIAELEASGTASAELIAALTTERDNLAATLANVEPAFRQAIDQDRATDAEVDAAVTEFTVPLATAP